jgi:hypothetical protein
MFNEVGITVRGKKCMDKHIGGEGVSTVMFQD